MSSIKAGDRVRIKLGPAAGLTGRVERVAKIGGHNVGARPKNDRLLVVRLDRPDRDGDRLATLWPYEAEPETA